MPEQLPEEEISDLEHILPDVLAALDVEDQKIVNQVCIESSSTDLEDLDFAEMDLNAMDLSYQPSKSEENTKKTVSSTQRSAEPQLEGVPDLTDLVRKSDFDYGQSDSLDGPMSTSLSDHKSEVKPANPVQLKAEPVVPMTTEATEKGHYQLPAYQIPNGTAPISNGYIQQPNINIPSSSSTPETYNSPVLRTSNSTESLTTDSGYSSSSGPLSWATEYDDGERYRQREQRSNASPSALSTMPILYKFVLDAAMDQSVTWVYFTGDGYIFKIEDEVGGAREWARHKGHDMQAFERKTDAAKKKDFLRTLRNYYPDKNKGKRMEKAPQMYCRRFLEAGLEHLSAEKRFELDEMIRSIRA